MLPIPKDKVAIQECVGEQVTNKEVEIWDKSPMKDRQEVEIWDKSPMKDRLVTFEPKAQFPAKVRFAVDVEMCGAPAKKNQWAPIKTVGGGAWSLGINQALRLLGKSLDVAWERSFIHPLTFN